MKKKKKASNWERMLGTGKMKWLFNNKEEREEVDEASMKIMLSQMDTLLVMTLTDVIFSKECFPPVIITRQFLAELLGLKHS